MTTYFYVLWFYHYNIIIVSSFLFNHGVLVSTHLQVLYMYSVGTLLVSVQTLIQFKWRCWGQKERGGGGREREIDSPFHFFFFYSCSILSVFHRNDWAAHFPVRNLNALSAYPVIINPTHLCWRWGLVQRHRAPSRHPDPDQREKKGEEEADGEDSPGEGQGGHHQQTDTGHETKA